MSQEEKKKKDERSDASKNVVKERSDASKNVVKERSDASKNVVKERSDAGIPQIDKEFMNMWHVLVITSANHKRVNGDREDPIWNTYVLMVSSFEEIFNLRSTSPDVANGLLNRFHDNAKRCYKKLIEEKKETKSASDVMKILERLEMHQTNTQMDQQNTDTSWISTTREILFGILALIDRCPAAYRIIREALE